LICIQGEIIKKIEQLRRGAGRMPELRTREYLTQAASRKWPATFNKRIRDANLQVLRCRKSKGPVEQRNFIGNFYRLGHLSRKPLSDNEVDDRLKAARQVLGDGDGETIEGNTALNAARRGLELLSLALIKIGLRDLEPRS
jgi:hypothetical protein